MRFLNVFDSERKRALQRAELRAPTTITAAARQLTEPLGTRRMRHIRFLLDNMGLVRSSVQRKFHEGFLQACSTHLYAQDSCSMADIMAANGWTHIKPSVLILTPRRYGKTTSVASFLAAYVIAVSHCECSVFSTGKRASAKMLDLVADLVDRAGKSDMICKQNCENLWLRGTEPGDVRKCNSYPSATSTLRGCGGDVLVLEEASFIDNDVFLQVGMCNFLLLRFLLSH